jgi:hypothetical protein
MKIQKLKIAFLTLLILGVVFVLEGTLHLKSLEISTEAPREFFIYDPVAQVNVPYWALTYRLENHTRQDLELALHVFLESDVKRVDQEVERIPAIIHKRLEEIVEEKDQRRYLNVLEMSKHPFRRGEVRDGIFIFRRPNRRADKISLFVDGLSSVSVRQESRAALRKIDADYVTVVRPETIEYQKRSEVRYRPYREKDFEEAEDRYFRERLIYHQIFVREGDEFHVHEDDIKGIPNEMRHWLLVLTPRKGH